MKANEQGKTLEEFFLETMMEYFLPDDGEDTPRPS
jgi:hypothetical protein